MRRPPRPETPDVSRRALTAVTAGTLFLALVLGAAVLPLPYAVQRPGPTVDTLGEHDGEPLIEVDGARTYPTSGELRLTTVAVSGGPGHPVTAIDVVSGWAREAVVVEPREAVFPTDATQRELDARSTAQMTSSQTSATVAALTELGYEVPATLTVDSTIRGTDADGKLRKGDVLTAIEPKGGKLTQLVSFDDLVSVLRGLEPGTPVRLDVVRDGQRERVDVRTAAPRDPHGRIDESASGSVLGVYLSPQNLQLPVKVKIRIEDIGGPSAGLTFALGIVDVLTPGALTGGETIAGTGTMSLAGDVGTIGGIRQKLAGARRDGAAWFLAPRGNCDEVVGHVPDGLRVVAVDTLSEARAAVEAIAADETAALPSCSAAAP